MITLLGILVLVLAAVSLVFRGINKKNEAYNAEAGNGRYQRDTYDFFNKSFMKPLWLGIIALALILFGIANPISLNDAGNRQVIQTIDGDLKVRFEPGLYVSGVWSKVTTWPNNFTIQVSREENKSPDADLWVISNPKDGTFSEGDNAELEHTVKWDLPSTEQKMIDLHVTYNNVHNLMSTTLLSYQKKIASFSTQRMSSEAHYSGGKSQLDEYFQDQLRNGQVLLDTETKTMTLEDGTSKQYISVEPKLDKNGNIMRSKSDIQTFDILSTYTSMDNVHYNGKIDVKLEEKIRYASEEANSKQELITEQQKEQTAIVKGRKLIAETTATEEAAEQTEVIRARKAKLVAAEKLEEDRYKAASTLALKKAEAEGDKLKVAAGLSPLEQAKIDKETAIGVASALAGPAGIKFPEIVVSGGNGGNDNGGGALQTLQLKMLHDLAKDMAKKK